MKLKIKKLQFSTGRPVCMINKETAKKISLHVGHRVSISKNNKKIISIVDTVSGFLKPNEIAVSNEISEILKLKPGDFVNVEITQRPQSINLIKKKLKGEKLSKKEILEIITNISNNSLTEAEIAFFISAVYTNGMDLSETKYLTEAMIKTGNKLRLGEKIADKHCIGGIAGNRTTPLVVSICAVAGLKIPKTSSRAITSAAGTVDVIETIAKVDYSIEKIKKIIKKTNACFVWGGALGLAPVDDKIIKIGRIVRVDSQSQLLASILSKKISVGSKYVLIDIPYGKSAKVSKLKGEKLKTKFLKLGKQFNLKMKVVLTQGSEPIGRGIGPILEIQDILKILKRDNGPKDLENKSIFLSGELLELTGKSKKGKGEKLAREILESGKAFSKFLEIIKEQDGKINPFKIPPFSYLIKAKKKIKIKHLDNKLINRLARTAGCPEDKLAGVYLNKKKNETANKGETILTIHTTSKEKLKYAKEFYNQNKMMVEVY